MKLSFMQHDTLNEENMGSRERGRTWGERESRTRGERKKGEMKASRGGNVLEQGHKVGPSTFIFTVNIFISVFHVVAVKVQKENKIELKLYDVDILLLYTHNVG